jgi:tetratricopeptide (TPR) repeat protein
MVGLADDCAELRQYEKAISQLSRVLRHKNEPDVSLLNKMALYAGYMGDQEREEKIYRMAIDENPDWGTLWFNLALLQKRQGRFDEAREAIDTAINVEPDEAPYYVLQAQLAKADGQNFAIILDLADLHSRKMESQGSWELHWSIVAAELRGDKEKVETIRKLRQKKSLKTEKISRRDGGCLPGVFQRSG